MFGKKDLVFTKCPSCNAPYINSDIIYCAFKYVLDKGKDTCAVQIVVQNILENWDTIDKRILSVMKVSIQNAIRDNTIGKSASIKEWNKILDKYFSERRQLSKNGE